MRRRRKPRVVWLPPAAEARNQVINPAISDASVGAFSFNINVAGTGLGTYATGLIPMVSDIPAVPFQSGGLPISTLADIQSSGYRLRRCVGKIYAGLGQNDTTQGDTPQVLVTAGLIVLRVREDGTPLLPVASYDDYSPAIIKNWSDPWIWRRSWMFSNLQEAIFLQQPLFADSNQAYGSVMDGPHVDARTARIVGPEERLFLSVTAQVAAAGTNPAGTALVYIWGEMRFVASMRTMAGNRRNASR